MPLLFDRFRVKLLARSSAVAAITVISALALAGCSGQSNQNAGVDKEKLIKPSQATINAINNAPPPPLNLPANMPQAEKDQIIAQQQQDIAAQNAARNRMFASMGMGGPKGKN